MPITDKTVFDAITILEDGQIQVRRARVILDLDGVTELSRTFNRAVLEPGQDVSSFPPKIRGICNLIWTPQVISDYLAAKAARALIKVGP